MADDTGGVDDIGGVEHSGPEQSSDQVAGSPVGSCAPTDPENFDHGEAKRRLKQLRGEQEQRRRKAEEVRRRDEDAMREQMKLDEARLQTRLQVGVIKLLPALLAE